MNIVVGNAYIGKSVEFYNSGKLFPLAFISYVNFDNLDSVNLAVWDDDKGNWFGIHNVQHISQNQNNWWK